VVPGIISRHDSDRKHFAKPVLLLGIALLILLVGSAYIAVQTLNPTRLKRVAFVTSEWLCQSNRPALLSLTRQVRATDIQIYVGADTWLDANWDWKMRQIDDHISYFRDEGLAVWLYIGIHTLDESKGIAHNIQSYVDRYRGKIVGIDFDINEEVKQVAGYTARDIENWLVTKRNQLARNGMSTMYYHGDGASLTDEPVYVNPTYLTDEGIILRAWLQDDGSWKPATFHLKQFWINYVILAPSASSSGSGQTYDEIMNWYRNIVIARYGLKNNTGATTLLWEVMNQRDMPGSAQTNAMSEVSLNWVTPA